MFCLSDPRDIGAEGQVRCPHNGRPTLFLYDAIPGGVGLAEKLFEVREALLESCLAQLASCACEDGCPGCVGAQAERGSRAKKAARMMLEQV